MKKSETCPKCETKATTKFYEILKVSTHHKGYNIGMGKDSYWICADCLLSMFNKLYKKERIGLIDAEMAYEFVSSDMTIISEIYLEISDSLRAKETEEDKKESKDNFSEMMKEMPETSNLLGFEQNKSNREGILKKTNLKRSAADYDDDLLNRMLLPKEIEAQLKKTIIGQDRLVRDLSIGAYKYLTSLTSKSIKRSNIFIMGASGTGKTESIKALAKILNRPLFQINSSMLTPTGYRGENLNTIAEKLVNLYGKEGAKTAILYFDEFDKVVDPDGNNEIVDFKKAVIPELYKILDGDVMITTGVKGDTHALETSGMLVIMTGAFQKMEESKNRKLAAKAVGLSKEESSPVSLNRFSFGDVTRADLVEYGFPAELVGRFSIRTHTVKFDRNDYLRILRTSNISVLKEYNHIFKSMRSTIEYTDEFLLDVIEKSSKERTGARTMYAIIEERLLNELYNAELMVDKRIVIKKDSTDILEHDGSAGPGAVL